MTRTRKDVWNLTRAEGDWPELLVAYERAVGRSARLDPRPGSPPTRSAWRFLAAMHGLAARRRTADTQPTRSGTTASTAAGTSCPGTGCTCRPSSRSSRTSSKTTSGRCPTGTPSIPTTPGRRSLPPAFRDRRPAASSRINGPLWPTTATRCRTVTSRSLDALDADRFSTPAARARSEAASGRRRASAARDGLLEDTPHGAVHVLVGNDYDAERQSVPVRLDGLVLHRRRSTPSSGCTTPTSTGSGRCGSTRTPPT